MVGGGRQVEPFCSKSRIFIFSFFLLTVVAQDKIVCWVCTCQIYIKLLIYTTILHVYHNTHIYVYILYIGTCFLP